MGDGRSARGFYCNVKPYTDRGLRHSTCSGGRQHVGRRSFCAALFGGGYRLRSRGQRRLRGAQQGLGWTIGPPLALRAFSFVPETDSASLRRSAISPNSLSGATIPQLGARRCKGPLH